jgi:CHAD domain-containing protein
LNESAENSQYSSTVLRLIADSRSVRQRAHRKLARTISKESFKDLEEQFHSAVKAVLGQPGLFRPINVQAAGHQVISARLQDLLDLACDIYDPFNGDALHEIRIAAKRLRYALEVFAPVFGNEAQVLADEVARMQTFLGDLHNYDLWISGLRRRLRTPETNHLLDSSDREGAAWILSEFVKERTNCYRSALDLWTAWERTGFEKRFETLIDQ